MHSEGARQDEAIKGEAVPFAAGSSSEGGADSVVILSPERDGDRGTQGADTQSYGIEGRG